MKGRIASLAAAVLFVGGAVVAPSASANGSFAVSIGVPGLAVGYSNRGGYVAAYAPPVYAATPAYYPSAYYGPPAVYGEPVVAYGGYAHRPWNGRYYHPYYRHW